ncbi:MAG: HD domain-containing phosphohydrolase [Bacillota bacterium]
MMKLRILIVDDDRNIVNALLRTLNGLDCEFYVTSNPEEVIQKLYSERFDIIITDQRMPKVTGLEILKEAKKIDADIVGILITGFSDIEVVVSAINETNVFRYIPKPWINEELVNIVKEALAFRKERIEQIANNLKNLHDIDKYKETIKKFREEMKQSSTQLQNALIKVIKAKDIALYEHSVRVSNYAMIIADNMGINNRKKENLRLAALLHDIGKIAVKDQILDKPKELESHEFKQIKKHSLVGYEILNELDNMQEVALIICQHHERIDGKGYPFGVSGEFLMEESKILSVADSYDALTSDRVYRKALSKDEALKILLDGATTQYDLRAVEALKGGLYGKSNTSFSG